MSHKRFANSVSLLGLAQKIGLTLRIQRRIGTPSIFWLPRDAAPAFQRVSAVYRLCCRTARPSPKDRHI